jgi:uncharacterized OB-fold protein
MMLLKIVSIDLTIWINYDKFVCQTYRHNLFINKERERKMDKKIITCPKCGHENLFPEEECAKCGSSFALFPELRHLFAKQKQDADEMTDPAFEADEQQEKELICPKCGQENAPLSVECSKCGVIFLKYYEIQARDETDEEKKAELLKKKEEEEKKTEALRKQKEKEERAEALKKQKEEEEKAKALRKRQEEEARADALRKQKEEEEKAEALRKQKEEEEQRELQKKIEEITRQLKPKSKIRDVLKKYEGQDIGINYNRANEIKNANLVKVGDDLFTIVIIEDQLMQSYPLASIISVREGINGVRSGDKEDKSTFSVIIQVYQAVS